MTYFIRPVERELMPDGHDWLFVSEHGGCDQHFFVANDVGALALSAKALQSVICSIAQRVDLGVRVA